MIARLPAWILALAPLLGGCGGARDRPEPPSGAVDPGIHGLTTPGSESAARGLRHDGAAPSSIGAAGGLLPGHPGAAGAPARSPEEPVSEATSHHGGDPHTPGPAGKILMTREHCETLGRKFAELTLAQGGALGELGAGSAGEHEAAGVGRTFAERCGRDMVGQQVEAREYQCMLRATTADDLLGCRR